MIGILVTAENKAANNLSTPVGGVYTISQYPTVWRGVENIVGGYRTRTDLHIVDGWKDVVQPTIGANQKRGAIYYDEAEGYFTYEVTDKTVEELQQEQISASEANKQALIQAKLEEQVVSEAQELDDTEALENQVLYPFWAPDQTYTLNQKCQYVVGTEIWLFKINQPTLVTSELNPPNSVGSEALYSRVAFPDEILAWVAPTGAHNAYQIGDKVYYPNVGDEIWISKINANTTVPDGDVPFNRYWEPFVG